MQLTVKFSWFVKILFALIQWGYTVYSAGLIEKLIFPWVQSTRSHFDLPLNGKELVSFLFSQTKFVCTVLFLVGTNYLLGYNLNLGQKWFLYDFYSIFSANCRDFQSESLLLLVIWFNWLLTFRMFGKDLGLLTVDVDSFFKMNNILYYIFSKFYRKNDIIARYDSNPRETKCHCVR